VLVAGGQLCCAELFYAYLTFNIRVNTHGQEDFWGLLNANVQILASAYGDF
jgi:hypothetical protein